MKYLVTHILSEQERTEYERKGLFVMTYEIVILAKILPVLKSVLESIELAL